MYKFATSILKTCMNTTTVHLRHAEQRQIHRYVAPTLRELQRRRKKVGPEKPAPRSSHLEWNYDSELFAFGKRLGEEFKDDLLRRALTHKSYANIQKDKDGVHLEDNYELISKGNNIISNYLKKEFSKNYTEVIVKALHDYLTTEKMLAHVALHIGLTDIILCNEFPVKEKTLADTFSAIIASLKMSTCSENAERFLKDFLVAQLTGKELFDIWEPEKPYEYLKNWLKDKEIEPRLCNEAGSGTILANYQVGLYSKKELLGIGFGESIEIAKDTAALDALQRLYLRKTSSV